MRGRQIPDAQTGAMLTAQDWLERRPWAGSCNPFSRFDSQLLPTVLTTEWRYVDRAPRPEATFNAHHIYHRLAHLDAAEPLRFRFDGDAQELFVAWLTDLEGKLRSLGLHPAPTVSDRFWVFA